MKISRRDFLKGSGAALVSFTALGALPTFAAADNATTTAAATKGIRDGKYVTKAMGHENYIHVATTIFDGKITDCRVLSHEETMGIGNFACSRIPALIVKHQSVNVPNVHGSMISSLAVKEAVKLAITEAGYKVDDFNKKIEIEKVGGEEKLEADVVIVGAGTAGLVAGLRLIEQGKKVILVEKNDIAGGSMAMTYGGFFCADSELVKNFDVTGTLGYDLETYMSFMKPYVKAEYDRYDGAMPYQTALYSVSGKLVDWLHGMGVGFNSLGTYEQGTTYGASPYLAPGCYKGGAGYLAMFLANRIAALGGQIIYSTSVDAFIKDKNGDVIGVTAVGDNSTKYTINAKRTVLASGGFAKNKNLLKKYYPDYADYLFNCCDASTGDMVSPCEELGAYIECGNREIPAFLSSYKSKFELAFIHYSAPGIMVNSTGDSIGNFIKDNHYSMGRAKIDTKKNGKRFFYIMDDASAAMCRDNESYGFDGYKALFDKGEAVRYDSLEACVKALDLPGLTAAIEANNKAALSGEPDEFGRKGCPYIETRDGLWAVQVDPTFYLTPAGLAIDTEAHLLKEDGSKIPNVYAIGDIAGSVEEKDGKPYGCGFIAATCYGWIVAETLKKEMK